MEKLKCGKVRYIILIDEKASMKGEKMSLIYIADDDENICKVLKSQLESDGYEVEAFEDGISLLERFKSKGCDLVITDIMMPKMSGYDLCREIRKTSDVPIIMISAKDEEIDRLLGLELGSDDYISKPFSLREVSIKANRSILVHGKEFKATVKEYDLLELLIENKNQAFSREMIIQKVWGYDYYGDTRQVDHLVKRLRKKMLIAESQCRIETIWGYGYKVSDRS